MLRNCHLDISGHNSLQLFSFQTCNNMKRLLTSHLFSFFQTFSAWLHQFCSTMIVEQNAAKICHKCAFSVSAKSPENYMQFSLQLRFPKHKQFVRFATYCDHACNFIKKLLNTQSMRSIMEICTVILWVFFFVWHDLQYFTHVCPFFQLYLWKLWFLLGLHHSELSIFSLISSFPFACALFYQV